MEVLILVIGGIKLETRSEKYKKKCKTPKKILLLFVAIIITFSIGNGKNALAEVDVSSLLTKWFMDKKERSVEEIGEAILAEQVILEQKLELDLKAEIDAADEELESFTEQVKAEKIAVLRQHAANLIANFNIDNSEQQAAITANINSIVENAIAQMNGAAATVPETVVEPAPETPAKSEPVEVPETKPEPISERVPAPVTPTPEPSPITDPIIEPVTESETEEETEIVEEPTTESTPEPISTPPNIVVEDVQANRDSSLEDELTE